MPQLSPGAAVLLALGLAVLVNAILLVSVARSGLRQQIRMLREAAQRARDPWGSEQKALEELSRRVAELPEAEASPTDDLLGQ
jgi:hypothetical protein